MAFAYNQRGKGEQYIKEGKNAIKRTRLSCRKFRDNVVRLQLHTLAYNLGNFMRTLALPDPVEQWSLTTLREKLIMIGPSEMRPKGPFCPGNAANRRSIRWNRLTAAADTSGACSSKRALRAARTVNSV